MGCNKLNTLDPLIFDSYYLYSLGNPYKGRQRFVDAIVLIPAPDSSKRLLTFKNVGETPLECGLRTSKDAGLTLFQTV